MGLSDSLSKLALILLRDRRNVDSLRVTAIRSQSISPWIVGISLIWREVPLKSSAVADSVEEAFLKAFSEMGENLLMEILSLDSRCGLAGGVFFSEAIARAQAELVERDAFLWHYLNEVPFLDRIQFSEDPDVFSFRLNSAVDGFQTFLVTGRREMTGNSECLQFGVASGPSAKGAMLKAYREYLGMQFLHRVSPDYCDSLERSPKGLEDDGRRMLDRHHSASRDIRNRDRFQQLCSGGKGRVRGSIAPNWKIQRLSSPLRGFCFARVESESLLKMTFGEPIPGTADLLHPFW